MAFKKTGVAPIDAVYCPCGGVIDPKTKKCDKCGKEVNKKKEDTSKD